jgi:hypothetical protein
MLDPVFIDEPDYFTRFYPGHFAQMMMFFSLEESEGRSLKFVFYEKPIGCQR